MGGAFNTMEIKIITDSITRSALTTSALQSVDGSFVKGVVDLGRGVMAIGGELHADEETTLLEDGSTQGDLWGINLYLDRQGDDWIEFDSMINIRPRQGNRSRSVEDPAIRAKIVSIVNKLVI